jgi:hypothetical protein
LDTERTERYVREVLELLVFEVVNLRAPLGTSPEGRKELVKFAKEFYRNHKEVVDTAIRKEKERSEEAGVSFNIEKFMQDVEPEALKVMPKWLNKNPWPTYDPPARG